MFWHIDADIIALIVIGALYVYNILMMPQTARTLRDTRFIWCLQTGMVLAVIDIAASIIMEVPVSPLLYHPVMMLYYIAIELLIISWFYYCVTIVYHDAPQRQRSISRLAVIPFAFYAALVLSNPWTGLFFTLGLDNVYQRGPLFFLMVAVYAFYALLLLLVIVIRRRHIPAGYPGIVLLLIPVIVAVSIAVQLAIPGWLLILPGYMICLVLACLFLQTVRIKGEREQIQKLTEQIENFACGLAICDITTDHRLEINYLSNGYSAICEADNTELSERYREDILTGVHPDDRGFVLANLEDLARTLKDHEMTYRYITGSGKQKWINVKAKAVQHADGSATCYATYTDLTEQKQLQQQLSDIIHTVPCGICLYCWDGDDLQPLLVNNRLSEMLGEDALEYLNKVDHLNYEHVHPADLAELQRQSLLALTATHEIDTTYRSLNYKTNEYLWVRMRGIMLPQPDGTQLVYVSYYDVTQEHLAEKEYHVKYELEKNRPSLGEEDLMVHSLLNLTTGDTLEYAYRDGSEVPLDDRTALDYGRDTIDKLLPDANERAEFRRLNDAEYLLQCYDLGQTEFQLDYRRRLPSGDINWVRNIIHLMRAPGSSDVLLFEYYYNIEEEKLQELMYHSLAADSYDYVARINGKNGSYVVFPREGLTYRLPPLSGTDADAVAMTIYNAGVMPEDREMAVHNTLIANIKNNLAAQERFSFSYREVQPDDSILHKKITQYYLDRQREIIIMTREDVTQLIKTEAEKNEMLRAALDAAKQANMAKSQFLSRVSHELRTPLNAIIGFMELARGADVQQMESYLANSDVAARQLLAIINDVLDMSSIESGKLKLAQAPFSFKQLICSVTNIYVAQCQQKGLSYATQLLTPLDEWLLGDKMRVNQILLNLLNNAVKFTEQGSVCLKISQHAAANNKVVMRFEIVDSGCGMSEDMLSRLFRPFEQESAQTAQKFGGNGLGLSIVSSLVSMMGGVISVRSKPGVGSSFTVDLPFQKSEAAAVMQTIDGIDKLHVLAVDDEPVERDYISVVLSRIGVRYSCVAGGDHALKELDRAAAGQDNYNICLIDWKMPDMNGIETTRRIREKYGQDVIVIVVSAYEHYQADESAREAGANIFISKPLFQSSLFDLFMTLTGGSTALAKEAPAVSYDFDGKRILLVEDNVMNRMVAEGLLRKMGIACDCAANGQIAVDMFISRPAGYFDAVLMDIQMPVLDGFAATRAIRTSLHPEAKSMQIIALTANAFNEDIARTLASGMNAHVAKPIEPEVLSAVLDKAFRTKGR